MGAGAKDKLHMVEREIPRFSFSPSFVSRRDCCVANVCKLVQLTSVISEPLARSSHALALVSLWQLYASVTLVVLK